MLQGVRITTAVVRVLASFVDRPADDRYGRDLIAATGLPSGTLYPILVRLQRAGWIEDRWEEEADGRPARRYYRLTADGLIETRRELAELHQQLSKMDNPIGKPRAV